jgi:hypothetical protein
VRSPVPYLCRAKAADLSPPAKRAMQTESQVLLFSDLSIATMFHGIVLGGTALMGLAAALFYLRMTPALGTTASGAFEAADAPSRSRSFSWLLVFVAVILWLTVLGGTYIVFPAYRVAPPEGALDLSAYPRSFLLANPGTAWLHAFAMEIKEHVPWIAAMLATAVAFAAVRDPRALFHDRGIRRAATLLLVICFLLVGTAALLGTFINKVAPLQ